MTTKKAIRAAIPAMGDFNIVGSCAQRLDKYRIADWTLVKEKHAASVALVQQIFPEPPYVKSIGDFAIADFKQIVAENSF